MKNKIKTLIPLLIGLFVIIGGLTLLNTQQVEANPEEGSYCNYIPKAADCWPGGINNCICLKI